MAAPHVFTNEEMTDMMLVFGEANENSRLAAALYQQRFPERVVPRHQRFPELRDRLKNTGTFAPVRRNEVVRSARAPEAIPLVQQVLNADPHTSTRKTGKMLNMSHVSVHRIIKHDLGMHPFKRHAVQQLLPGDPPRRLQMCQWLLDKVDEAQNNPAFPGDFFINRTAWTDECIVLNDGSFNHHNEHHYAVDNPHCTKEAHFQGRISVAVWGGVLHDRIIGPFFFEENVNANVYTNFLLNDLDNLLEDTPLAVRDAMWFQQDGHPAQSSLAARAVLGEKFPGRWIGLHSPVQEWSRLPCSFAVILAS
ncbi:Histone-lysine N-methyltransferase SETMAR [Frankliniella fusca]|uniref:Histone-lysine N-methyltransferase SETMAR n=1 Tax=Frankliniella fusca TaxID=407009 RepID=A0AAE1HXT4_9NEOP|nr:Histone-lysine N-methyltransferase SETMAR [Frankliniella fusca]